MQARIRELEAEVAELKTQLIQAGQPQKRTASEVPDTDTSLLLHYVLIFTLSMRMLVCRSGQETAK